VNTSDLPPDEPRETGESETVGRPEPDDAPPGRGPLPFVWLALIGLVVVAVGGLLLALAAGILF